jgi:5-methylcytosine-specific restriction endonuclease McrA
MPSYTGKRRGLDAVNSHDRRRRRRVVLLRDGEFCVWCGAREDLTLDHIVPWARGGTNRIENLQPLCAGCNQLKGDTSEPAAAVA